MKEIITTNTNYQTPIEIALGIDVNGMTTARKLYEFLELAPRQFSRWAKSNIVNNDFATENEDYWGFDINVEGNKTVDYRLTAHFAKKLSIKGNGERAEQAREYFTRLEERVKQKVIDRSQLSPETQALYALIDGQAKLELEQKRQDQEISRIDTTVTNMKKVFVEPISDWKSDIRSYIKKIADGSGQDYQVLYDQLYDSLEKTAHCNLKRLQTNKQKRMEDSGRTKTEIRHGTSKLAIISERPRLKAIFEGIVKQSAMAYC